MTFKTGSPIAQASLKLVVVAEVSLESLICISSLACLTCTRPWMKSQLLPLKEAAQLGRESLGQTKELNCIARCCLKEPNVCFRKFPDGEAEPTLQWVGRTGIFCKWERRNDSFWRRKRKFGEIDGSLEEWPGY